MKKLDLLFTILFSTYHIYAQDGFVDKQKVQKDLEDMIQNIADLYIYLEDKKLELSCIQQKYTAKIDLLTNQADVILFFENL